MSNLYEILEVSEKASDEIIEKAYKTLAKKYHPDLQQNEGAKVNAGNKMKEINVAYETLIDPAKRARYDEELQRNRQQEMQKQSVQSQNNFHKNPSEIYQNQSTVKNNESYKEGQAGQPNKIENWRDLLRYLTNPERRKLKKKIEKNARKEYEAMYRQYYRNMGYRVKRRITFRGVMSVILVIVIMISIGFVLWKIPKTHNYFVNLYQENFIFKLIVDIVSGIINGLLKTFKNTTSSGF